MLVSTRFTGVVAATLLFASSITAVAQTSRLDYMVTSDGQPLLERGTASHEYIGDALEFALLNAIDPGDYICLAPTDLDLWVDDQLAQIDLPTLGLLFDFNVLSWAGDYKTVTDHDGSDDYIGVNGELTRKQVKTFRDNKRFYDIYSDDIQLLGMHGADIGDDAIMPFLYWAFAQEGAPPWLVDQVVQGVRTAITGGTVDIPFFGIHYEAPGIPGGYDNPLFTLNAFAYSFDPPLDLGFGVIVDKIVIGDGLLQALRDIGLGRESADYVLSHEFGHHVQFETGAIEPGPAYPEKTRREELMADGFGAYYSSHARGATFQPMRFAEVMNTAFQLGDCAFGSAYHHGTQLQRERAAAWGDWLSSSAENQGHILGSMTLLELFELALPDIVAPDVP